VGDCGSGRVVHELVALAQVARAVTAWRRRVAVVGVLAAVHYVAAAGAATWVALTEIPRRCWSGALYDWRIDQGIGAGGDCDQYGAAFVSVYAGVLGEDTESALAMAELLFLRLPVIAAAGLVGSVNQLIDGNSWFALFVSMHAVGALLWAIGIYGIWSGIQFVRRRRQDA
jgi:hypothetical protein